MPGQEAWEQEADSWDDEKVKVQFVGQVYDTAEEIESNDEIDLKQDGLEYDQIGSTEEHNLEGEEADVDEDASDESSGSVINVVKYEQEEIQQEYQQGVEEESQESQDVGVEAKDTHADD